MNKEKDLNPTALAADLYAQHKAAFNKQAFSIDANGASPVRMNGSFVLTEREWEHHVQLLTNWNSENKEDRQRFRAANKFGYVIAKKYKLFTSTLPDGTQVQRLIKIEKGNESRLFLHQLQVFDAIHEAHVDVGHLKRDRTWMSVKSRYYNVPQNLVALYISLCPICNTENPSVPAPRGAKKPILSNAFRDRFQIDLVDMRK